MRHRSARTSDRTYRAVIALFRVVFRLADVRFDVRGAEHLPATGPGVVACNHIGYLDFTFVGLAATRRDRLVRFMAKQATFTHPVSGPLMRRMRHIPVDRDGVLAGAVAYRRAIRAVRAGELVGIFPESTISRSWTLREFKPGAVALAVREQVPLIPVVVWGGHRLASTDGHVQLRRHLPVTVLVGEPIDPRAGRDVVGTLLRARLQDLLDVAQRDYPDRPAAGDDWWQPLHLGGTGPTPAQAADLEAAYDARREAKQEAKQNARRNAERGTRRGVRRRQRVSR